MSYKNGHTLGLGQFLIPLPLQDAATTYGLKIEKTGGGFYQLLNGERQPVPGIMPEFAAGREQLNLDELKAILEFLHQPIGASIRREIPSKKEAHEQRILAHKILSYLTSGTVTLPDNMDIDEDTPDHLEDDDHVETEHKMREEDSWLGAREIGGDPSRFGKVPNTSYDSDLGLFNFKIHALEHRNANQKELSDSIKKLLRSSGVVPPSKADKTLLLTGAQIENLCHKTIKRSHDLAKIVNRVEFDEHVHDAISRIDKRAAELTVEESIQNPASIKQILQMTSALTPILRSDVMQDAWSHYHFTSRNENPAEKIIAETTVFQSVLGHYARQKNINGNKLQAVSEEFQDVIAFSKEFFAAMEKTANKARKSVSEDFLKASDTARLCETAPLTGHHKQTLSCINKSLGLVSVPRQVGDAGWDVIKGFGKDMYSMTRESPGKTTLGLIAAGGMFYLLQSGSNNSEMLEYMRSLPENALITPGSNGSVYASYDTSTLPEEAHADQNWHYDPNIVKWLAQLIKGDFDNPIGVAKHYLYDIYVTKPPNVIFNSIEDGMKWVSENTPLAYNENNHFLREGRNVIQPVADSLFYVNIFQNMAHAGFWAYMVGKGVNQGLAGGSMLLNMARPIGDLACSGAQTAFHKAADALPSTLTDYEPKAPLHERFLTLIEDNSNKPNIAVQPPPSPSEPSENTKKSLCKKWMIVAGEVCVATAAVSVGMDMIGQHQAFTDAVSAASGPIAAGSMTLGAFTIYQFFDDIVLNHVVGGAAWLALGAGARAVYKKTAEPTWRTLKETARDIIDYTPRL